MKFPHENKKLQYGSVYPMCASNLKTSLTLLRIIYLKQWLEGVAEGNVCAGSLGLSSD